MAYRLGYFLLLSLMSFNVDVNSMTIESADTEKVIVNITGGIYMAYMDENNHEFVDGSRTPILKITDNGSDEVEVVTAGDMFKYLLNKESDDTYILYSLQSFDYELNQRKYTFKLGYKTSSGDEKIVSLRIQNIDDEPPTLTSPQCNFLEKRTYTKDNSTCSAVLSDPDGWLDQTTFKIVNSEDGNEDQYFKMEFREPPADTVYKADVYMTVIQPLKYETKTFFFFNIRAQDGAGHPTIPDPLVNALVTVNDTRGNPPVWTKYASNTEYTEKTVQKFHVQARDGDTGINDPVYYEKISEQEKDENYISINKTTGEITVNKIDRDRHDISTYEFDIIAYVEPKDKWKSDMKITLHVIDVDDNPPVIMNSTVNETIVHDFDGVTEKVVNLKFIENYASSLNTSTEIVDKDTGENAEFTVRLEDLEDSKIEYTSAFFVAPNAGYKNEKFELAVRNAKHLDYEDPDWDNFQFYILTEGLIDQKKRDRLLINISLIDYNDEWPIFDPTEFETSINETANDGFFIIQVMATDRDAEDKILDHSLSGSSFATGVLRIEPDTGKIYVKGNNSLDYDKVNPIFVQVKAVDKVGHTAFASVTIDLLDVNNKQPSITSGDIINVEENQKIGTTLNSSIKASDPDTTANLTVEIDWDKSYAVKNSRRVTNESEFSNIRFLDVKYEINYEDKSYPNRAINIELVVNSNNPDQTAPDYELFDSLFLTLTVIDWNTDPEFMDKRSVQETILISIIDINDNIPYFPDDEIKKERTIQEIQYIGTSAGIIAAVDKDVNDVITYNCSAEDPTRDWVAVNTKSGEFLVKQNMSCDYPDPVWTISYICNAFDGFHYSDPAKINFKILDYNNKKPEVKIDPEKDGFVHVLEKSPANTPVDLKLTTSDLDRDVPFHTVGCLHKDPSSYCAQQFSIKDNSLYVLHGGNYIDRDNGLDKYVCTLTCSDNPDHQEGGISNPVVPDPVFTIKLDDQNDHTPSLDKQAETTIPCYENITANLVITELIATDIDEEGPNNEIHFVLESAIKQEDSKDHKELFLLDYKISKDSFWWVDNKHKRAHLVPSKDLKDNYGHYNISIELSDRGTPQRSQTQWFVLEVRKFNFKAPSFVFPAENQQFRLQKDQTPRTQLILQRKGEALQDFVATDNADCKKWELLFTIHTDDADFFTIDQKQPCSAQLQVKSTFQAEYKTDHDYKIKINARIKEKKENEQPMKGEEPYEVERNILVMFTNNAEQPVFNSNIGNWEFTFLEKDKKQKINLPETHKAKYEHDDEDLAIYYFIQTEDDRIKSIFQINKTTGDVSLHKELDFETDEEIEFNIVASGAENSRTFNCDATPRSCLHVKVNVEGINYYPPEWSKPKFYGVIMNGYQKDFPVAEATATDRDKIDKGKLHYKIYNFIHNGNGLDGIPKEPFTIVENSGRILLNFQVDASMSGHVDFTVEVQDQPDGHGNGPHLIKTSVTIFFITAEYLVKFKFLNTKEEVLDQEENMLRIVSDIVTYNASRQNIDVNNGTDQMGNLTVYADLFFINEQGSDIEVVERSEILRILSNWDKYLKLSVWLKNETGLSLIGFENDTKSPEDLHEVLKTALIAVTVVLGLACIVLLILFIIKVRQLNNRIAKLVNKKFGSEESGLNRLGLSLPNSNKHVVEGSNPIFSISDRMKEKDFFEDDRKSVSSGDSDLIGVENDPKFDYKFDRDA